MTRNSSPFQMRGALANGRQQLDTRFKNALRLSLRTKDMFVTTAGVHDRIYRLEAGWACQLSQFPNARQAIIDIYLPGDIVGLDTLFRTRPVENVMALTAVEIVAIDAQDAFPQLMGSRCTALYIAWLLGRQQRRADRLLSALSCCDARSRLGMMILDFHKRLSARNLVDGKAYNMPLTQRHIAQYLGLSVIHVNRVVRSLRDNRIAIVERNCVTILDIERLTQLVRERGVSTTRGARGRINGALSGGVDRGDMERHVLVRRQPAIV
jgi:CRP/FNR family transcriptional regulator